MIKGSRIQIEPDYPDREPPRNAASGDNGSHESRPGSSAERGSTSEGDWPDPLPIEEYLRPVIPLTRAMMPEALGTYACDIAYRLQCPLEFVMAPAIVMIGSLLGTRVRTRMKQH